MATQKEIKTIMGISQTAASFMLSGTRPVTWPQAEKLADLFPEKDIRGWKYATPEEIKKAFNQKEAA